MLLDWSSWKVGRLYSMARYYDWSKTFSYQTGTQGEFCIVAGAKNIGKTFGLRLALVNRFLKTGEQFCEVSRTETENREICEGYLARLQQKGFFKGYSYKVQKQIGYLGELETDEDGNEVVSDMMPFVYFVSLSTFQKAKKRTYQNVTSFIFDEAIIDSKDRYHRYLPNEFSILANIIDTVAREDYENPRPIRCYLLANSCDLTCPYFRNLGIKTIPKFGYSWHNGKHTLLHYVEPWDVEERKANTLVGRMLAGSEEARMVFDNEFLADNPEFIAVRTSNAKFEYGIKYLGIVFGVWFDRKEAFFYVTDSCPKDGTIYALTKKDNTIDYIMARRTQDALRLLLDAFYLNAIRFDAPSTRELFFNMLSFLGVR